MAQPVISVCLITYNHGPYIERAIESILEQQLDVPYEICIGEDGSSDETRAICERYAQKYPDLIKLHLRDRSTVIEIDGRPTGVFNFLETLKACSGEYIALLEGDDQWIHPLKLQHQYEILEAEPDLAGCGHDCIEVVANQDVSVFEASTAGDLKELMRNDVLSKGSQLPTASLFFKKKALFPLASWYEKEPSDWKLEVALLLAGSLKKIDSAWSIYRIHEKGVYSGEAYIHQLRYRERQAYDIFNALEDKTDQSSLERYLAHTYHLYYQKLAPDFKTEALRSLVKFIGKSSLDPWTGLKHFIKEAWRISFNPKIFSDG